MTLDKIYLIGIWLEALFYGINFVLFWICLFVLTRNRTKTDINKFLVVASIFQILLSSTDAFLGLERLITGFILLRDKQGSPAAYFEDVPDRFNVARVLIIATNTVVGDIILVWRCYHVWGRSWKVAALPASLICGTAACSIGQAIAFSRARETDNIFSTDILHWNEALYSLSFATNVIVTGLIAFRVWTLLSPSSIGPAISTKILTLMIESGLIYSAYLVVLIGLYASKNKTFYIFFEPVGQLASIMPTMILLLVGMGLTSVDVRGRSWAAGSSTNTKPNPEQRLSLPPVINLSMLDTVVDITSSFDYGVELGSKFSE